MKASAYNYKRKNHAFRVAYLPDCRRIDTAPNLTTLVHGWAKKEIGELSRPALKVLRYLAALNRTGKTGYVGFAVAYEILAPIIGEATSDRFSKRSMERAIPELRRAGLVDVQPWIREGQFFKAGGRNVQMHGAGTVKISGGRVVVRRLAIVTLTDRALAMWELGRGRDPSENKACKLHVGLCPPAAKVAVSSPRSDQIDKSIMLGFDTAIASDTSTVTLTKQEGRPTCPVPPRAAPPTGEHRALTNPQPKPDTPPESSTRTASNEAPRRAQPASPPVSKDCAKNLPVGRGPCPEKSAVPRDQILSCLWQMLKRHTPRQADAIYSRAKWEIDQPSQTTLICSVDWQYWIGQWPKLSPHEREVRILREILPLLKKRPSFPSDRRKVVQTGPTGYRGAPPTKVAADLNPFLAGIVSRLGIFDDD